MGKNILQTTNKRVRPLWLCPLIKKIFTLFIWLLLLPVTALAADMNTVYVGGVALAGSSDNIVYATTNESGEVVKDGANANNYNIKWDGSTLTLHDATIQKELYASDLPLSNIAGAAIGVINQSGDAGLTVQQEGNNKIEGVSTGIHVRSSGGNAALNITGNGTLVVNSNYLTIQVTSIGGNATLSIENAKVTATSSYSNVVTVQSGNSENSSASLTVDGGSLTATAPSNNVSGIRFVFGSGGSGSGTPNLTVSGNATVRANGSAGGITNNSSTGVQYGTGGKETGGIIWNGMEGTVYGNVTLQEDLEIGEGESLTIPEGASLDTNGKLTVNGGTLNGTPSGSVTYKVTGVSLSLNTLTLYVGDEGTLTATITPDNASNKSINWESSDTGVATVDANGKVTAVSVGSTAITATAADGSGKSATCSVTVNAKPTYTISADVTPSVAGTATADKTTAAAGAIVTLTATANPGYRFTGWTSSNEGVTFDDPSSVSTTFTMPANDVIVTAGFEQYYPVTSITLDKSELSLYTDESETLTATIEPDNATNQTVIWSSDKPEVAMVDDDGKVTAMAAGKATITAMADGGKTATCVVQVREKVKVGSTGSTNLSFTTDQDEFTLTAIVYGENLSQEPNCWKWSVANEDVVELVTLRSKAVSYSTNRQAFTIKGTGTTTITATYDDCTYRGSVKFKVSISKPTPPDPISYYNIYVEDVCDGVKVIPSKRVVREGGSITVSVEKDTANYTFDNFKVYYKRSYYGTWNELPEGVQPGEYPIKNIWNHIYIKAEGAEEKEDPTGIESIEGVKVYTKDGNLYVQTPQREQVIIVSMSGVVVKNEEQVGLKQYHGLQPGIYIVRVGDRAYKLRLN